MLFPHGRNPTVTLLDSNHYLRIHSNQPLGTMVVSFLNVASNPGQTTSFTFVHGLLSSSTPSLRFFHLCGSNNQPFDTAFSFRNVASNPGQTTSCTFVHSLLHGISPLRSYICTLVHQTSVTQQGNPHQSSTASNLVQYTSLRLFIYLFGLGGIPEPR